MHVLLANEEENFLNMTFKKYSKINAANILLGRKMMKPSPQDQENKTRKLLSEFLYNISPEVQSSVISQEKDL